MADLKAKYSASAAYSCAALDSLASSASLVAGAETAAVNNETELALDYLVGGQFTVAGSGLSAGAIEVWAYGNLNDTPAYPDVLDGTASAETFAARANLVSSCKLVASIPTDTTAGKVYSFGPVGLAGLFGGFMPTDHGLFVTQSTGAALAADGNDLWYTPVQGQTA